MLLIVQAFASLFMTGLIWTIQLVHYPLYERVGAGASAGYVSEHMRRISWVVGPVMVTELACAVLLCAVPASGPGFDMGERWIGLAMLGLIWISTAAMQGPMNTALARSFDPALVRRLVRSNWIRTALWTARGVLALTMLVRWNGG